MKTKIENLLRFALLIFAVMFCYLLSAQEPEGKTGFIYVDGIRWTEKNENQDSVINIFIEKDTMQVIRELLLYCLLVKEERDASDLLLSTINLEQLQKVINSHYYDMALQEYKKVKRKNKRYLDAKFPQYAR